MRKLFVSYSRENRSDVGQLVEHLNLMGYDTWIDSKLRGGQDWWEEVLRRIANSDVFISIISRAALTSTACQRECDWAEALARPVLPVAVEPTSMALPGRFARRQIIDYSQPQQRDRAALELQGGLGTLTPPPVPDPLPEPPAAPLSYLTNLFDLVSQAEALNQDQQRDILDQLEHALRSFDQEERRGGHDILVRLSSRDDLYAAVDRTISQLRSVSDQASPELNKTLRVPDVDGGSTSDWLPTSGWMPTVVDDFWVDLLAPIRDQVLVPVVGPDLAVVTVGDAEQTFDTLIGRNLVDRYHLTVPPGMTTMGEAVAAFLRERGHDDLERLYRVINDIMMDLDPAPGDALRSLAAIDDLRLFVNTTPDRLLAEAVNEVRFQGEPKARELSFSPNKPAGEQPRNAKPPEKTDTVVLNLFGRAASTPQYAIHTEDRLEWLHALLSDTASLPNWLANPLKQLPMLFVGCEIPDSIWLFLLRMLSNTRLSRARKQIFFVGSSSYPSSLLSFLAYCPGLLVQQLEMAPTEFVAELRARWEQQNAARSRAGLGTVGSSAAIGAAGPAVQGAPTIFISYMRQDVDAARRLCDAITQIGGDVWLDERRLRPGDAWERETLAAIRRTVRLFVPIISANTEAEEEGYVFREWVVAIERSRSIMGRRFIVPVVIDEDYDGDPSRYRQIPEDFKDFGHVQFGHAPRGDPDAKLLTMLTAEIRAKRRTNAP